MTLNDLNGVIALILRFFPPNSIALPASYVTVVEDRSMMFVKYCLSVPVFHFWRKLIIKADEPVRQCCQKYTTFKKVEVHAKNSTF